MMTTETMPAVEPTDAVLVAASLDGNRDAFGQIIERYQALIASLAYCALGSISQSEDLAQETFVTAWKRLADLREPDKLRPWLCSIVRSRIRNEFRRRQREPVHAAETLDAVAEAAAPEPLPAEGAITEEEKAILWRALKRIPETYREPLVLFYREQQSIAAVALGLGLSEDAVKQRLARGRKFLQEEVRAFVERGLGRTAPGGTLSGAVLAALPLATGPTAAASVGLGTKGAAAAKSSFLAAWLAPLVGPLAAIAAQCLAVRAHTTDAGLRAKKTLGLLLGWMGVMGAAVAGEAAMRWLEHRFGWSARTGFAAIAGYWTFWVAATLTWSLVAVRRELTRLQRGELSGQTPLPALAPGVQALLVASLYLAMGWLPGRLAWKGDDRLWVGIIAATMLLLSVWHFFHLRGKTGTAGIRLRLGHVALAGALIAGFFSLRFDGWLASAHGVSVEEIRRLWPTWLVPLLTLAVAAWGVGAWLFTDRRARHAHPLILLVAGLLGMAGSRADAGVFPKGTNLNSLVVIQESDLGSTAQGVMVATLQGLVARRSGSQIYVVGGSASGEARSVDNITVQTDGPPLYLPDAPKLLTVTAANHANLVWRDNDGCEAGFKIERSTGATGVWVEVAAVSSTVTTFTDTTVSPGTNYSYRLRSWNAAGASAYSNVRTVATPPRPLLSVAPIGDSLEVRWPSWAANFNLASVATLDSAAVWSPVTGAATNTDGALVAVVPMGPSNQFFRLSSP